MLVTAHLTAPRVALATRVARPRPGRVSRIGPPPPRAVPPPREAVRLPRGVAARAAEGAGVKAFEEPAWAVEGSEEGFYEWKHGFKVHWERCGDEGPAVVLVPGFGVGTFHYERVAAELAGSHRVFAVDLLGQGQSWPPESPREGEELCYSVDLWVEQLADFIQRVVGGPAYMCGNSLGGLLSVQAAAAHPDLVQGVVLLNATPFWAFTPNRESSPRLASLMPWDGRAPAPAPLKAVVGKLWWDSLRRPDSIRRILGLVYAAGPEAVDDALVGRIIQPTQHPRALEAFASIAFAPKPALTFDEALAAVGCPICLLYGKEDPWVVPLWGQRAKRIAPAATYYEISPSGHCPHHETPEAVAVVLSGWVASVEGGGAPVGRDALKTAISLGLRSFPPFKKDVAVVLSGWVASVGGGGAPVG